MNKLGALIYSGALGNRLSCLEGRTVPRYTTLYWTTLGITLNYIVLYYCIKLLIQYHIWV